MNIFLALIQSKIKKSLGFLGTFCYTTNQNAQKSKDRNIYRWRKLHSGIDREFFLSKKFEKEKFMHHFFRMNFNFKKFFNSLIDENYQEVIKMRWYDARLNRFFSLEHRENQRNFFRKLKKQKFKLELGKIQGDPSLGKVKQKGVDTKMAIDLVILGVQTKYDIGFLVSSDWDFLPAVSFIQSIKKNPRTSINYIFFHEGYCKGLHDICTHKKKINWRNIKNFCTDELKVLKK